MPNRYSLALFTFSLISQVIVIPCAKYRSFTLFFRAEVLWRLCGNCAETVRTKPRNALHVLIKMTDWKTR